MAALWQNRDALKQRAAQLALPLMWGLILLAVLSSAASARALYALPLIVPLALLAAQMQALSVVMSSPYVIRFIPHAVWVVHGVFFLLACAVVFLWGLMWQGQGAHLPHSVARVLPAEYVMQWSLPHVLAACAVLFLWGWIVIKSSPPFFRHTTNSTDDAKDGIAKTRARGFFASCQDLTLGTQLLCAWVAGMSLVWGIAFTLCAPWINEAKSYRTMFAGFVSALQQQGKIDCIASINLGESERALLDYFHQIRTIRFENNNVEGCNVLLVQGGARDGEVVPSTPGFVLFWQGARMGDTDELYWAYKLSDN